MNATKSRKKPKWKPREQWRKYDRRGNGVLLTEAEFAKKLGEEDRTIRTWRHDGIIPAIVLGHRTVRFRYETVMSALQRRTVKELDK